MTHDEIIRPFGDDLLNPDDLLAPEQPLTGWDWDLMRRFQVFWPRHASAPPDFPWLGLLVTRKKAWRWASQFPRRLGGVEPTDRAFLLGFIAQTLTDTYPESGGGAEDVNFESKDKRCCKGGGGGDLPGGGDDHRSGWQLICGPPACPEGYGMLLEYDTTGQYKVVTGPSGNTCQQFDECLGDNSVIFSWDDGSGGGDPLPVPGGPGRW